MEEDRLDRVGVLMRREIEARLLAPLLEALGAEFDRSRVYEIARQVIIEQARQQGAQMAQRLGGCSLAHFAASLEAWTRDDALQIKVLEQNEQVFAFNVTRCRYAEMYRSLGVGDLGATFSCNRDAALIEGFNPQVSLERNQTIMEGAAYCDFRYTLQPDEPGAGSSQEAQP